MAELAGGDPRFRGRIWPGRRPGARPRRVRVADRRRGDPPASRAARRQRRRPSAMPTAASRIAAPGTSQAVRSKPDFGGSASTSGAVLGDQLVLDLVLGLAGGDQTANEGPLAVGLRRSGEVQRACRRSGTSPRPPRPAAWSWARAPPPPAGATAASTSGGVRTARLTASPSRSGRGRRSSRGNRWSPGRGGAAPACRPARPGRTRERPSSPAPPGRSRRSRRGAADR